MELSSMYIPCTDWSDMFKNAVEILTDGDFDFDYIGNDWDKEEWTW